MANPKLPPKVAEAVKYMAAGDHAAAAAALEAAGHHDHAAQQWVYAKMPARADMAQAQHEVNNQAWPTRKGIQQDYEIDFADPKFRPRDFTEFAAKNEATARREIGNTHPWERQKIDSQIRVEPRKPPPVIELDDDNARRGIGEDADYEFPTYQPNPDLDRKFGQEYPQYTPHGRDTLEHFDPNLGAGPTQISQQTGADYVPPRERPIGMKEYKEAWARRGEIPGHLRGAVRELTSGEARERLTGHPTELSKSAQQKLDQFNKDELIRQKIAEANAEIRALENPEVQPGFAGGREGVRRPLDKVTAATASPTAVPPGADPNEAAFRAWYAQHAKRWGLDPNPDAPEHQYDYRAAFNAGATPDKTGHWPSEFKLPGHPNRFVDGVDTITMKPAHKNVVAWAPPETGGPALYQQYLEMQNPARRYMPPAPVQPVMYRKAVPGPTMENQNIDVFPTLPKPPAG